jgi:hypothetical protein
MNSPNFPTDEQLGPLPEPKWPGYPPLWQTEEVRAIQRDTWARAIARLGKPIGVLTISKFRGHLENHDLDYFGSLPEGSHNLYAITTPAALAPVPEPENWQEKYYSLLMLVGNKHPGETRHETAARYIRQAEQGAGLEGARCAPTTTEPTPK